MRSYGRKANQFESFVILSLLAATLSACNLIGPASISQGRPAYNEVINRTNDEQMLLALVRRRYGESPSLLTVTSITASLRFRADTGVEAGFGSPDSYAGNLVPFSAGLAYEESPTITYAPVGGDLYMRQILSPLPLELMIGFMRSLASPGGYFALVVERINGIRNPGFLPSPSTAPDPRFPRVVKLLVALHSAGVVSFATISAKTHEFALVIREYVPSHIAEVRELIQLLSLPEPKGSPEVVVPLLLSAQRAKPEMIAVTTRSPAELIEILTAAIDVSEQEIRSGVAIDYPPRGPLGRSVRIRRSQTRPDDASVRIEYRDAWYYIADTDLRTKQFFRFLELVWGVAIARSTGGQAAPVLTVPVGN